MAEVQLFMRKPSLGDVEMPILKEGYSVHTHVEGRDEKVWEQIIEEAFEMHFSFDKCIRNGGGYKPEYVQYVSINGEDVATTTAVEKETFPGEGWMRMVGTKPSARGKGAGKLVMLMALNCLKNRGYKSVVLSTDDFRLPAISMYLSLGFEPIFLDPSHEERWKKVFEALGKKQKI